MTNNPVGRLFLLAAVVLAAGGVLSCDPAGSPRLLDTDRGDLRDSGKVRSAEILGLVFAGKPLPRVLSASRLPAAGSR